MRYGAEHILTLLERELHSLPDRKNEHVQHLVELGYIPLLLINSINSNQIKEAEQRFLHDALASGLFEATTIENQRLPGEDQLLTFLLRSAVDLDEGIQFKALPELNKVTLQSRIAHYRLNLMGFWDYLIDAPYTLINTGSQLNKLAELSKADPLETLNFLGNLDLFARHLLSKFDDEDFIVCFKSSHVGHGTEKLYDRRFAFKRQLLDDFGERSDYFRFLNQKVLVPSDHKIDFRFLNEQAKKPFARFVMQLIQVFQWRNGFYSGLVDNHFGNVTLESFEQTIEGFNQLSDVDIPPHRLLTAISQGYFLFNALFFLQEMAKEQESVVDTTQFLSDLTMNYNNANETERNHFDENFQNLRTQISDCNHEPIERKGFLQGIYYGIGSFLKRILRFSKKIFHWMANQFKKLSNFLRTIFTSIFDDLRTALLAFIAGYRFLLGKNGFYQTNNSGMLVSVVRIFGDSYTLSIGTTNQMLSQQIKQMKYSTKSLRFALDITSGILKIIINSLNIIAWPLVVLSTIRVYQEIKRDYVLIEAINPNFQ